MANAHVQQGINVSNLVLGVPLAVLISVLCAIGWNSWTFGARWSTLETTVESNTKRLDQWRSRIEIDHDMLQRIDERTLRSGEDIAEIKRLIEGLRRK